MLALVALPFWLAILLIIGPIIYFHDRGSIFYNAPRLGRNGKVFTMYKFRTMKTGAPDIRNEDGSTFNSEDDPRLTKIGRFLRKTSLDETPQILNVIKGDMSIVGPRPDLPEHIRLYEKEEERKLSIRPGITGYNQAYYRNAVAWKERITNDLNYVDRLSFWLDVKIILRTIASIVKGRNIYATQSEKLSKKTMNEDLK